MYKSETYCSLVRKKTRNIVLHSGAVKARKSVVQERSGTSERVWAESSRRGLEQSSTRLSELQTWPPREMQQQHVLHGISVLRAVLSQLAVPFFLKLLGRRRHSNLSSADGVNRCMQCRYVNRYVQVESPTISEQRWAKSLRFAQRRMYCKNLFFSGRTFSLPISRCMIRTKHYEAIFIFFILFIGLLVSNQLIIGKASVLWWFVLSCLMVHACTILRCTYRVPLFEALPPTLWDCHLRYKHKIKQSRTASGAHVGAIRFSSYWVICSDN